MIEIQKDLQRGVLGHVQRARRQSRERARRRKIAQFTVGNYVLVGRVRQHELNAKLMSKWSGPWHVFNDD